MNKFGRSLALGCLSLFFVQSGFAQIGGANSFHFNNMWMANMNNIVSDSIQRKALEKSIERKKLGKLKRAFPMSKRGINTSAHSQRPRPLMSLSRP
ncbi:MAG: hypothetical protein LBI35_03410 [Burkholderiales bacterium]|jgi:hypothetical protein|nr:hypothetical protein [Burkholderiales bacterium]